MADDAHGTTEDGSSRLDARRIAELEAQIADLRRTVEEAVATEHRTLRERILFLEARLSTAEDDLSSTGENLLAERQTRRDLARTLRSLEKREASLRRSHNRLTSRRSVQAALAIARIIEPLFRAVRQLRTGSLPPADGQSSAKILQAGAQAELEKAIRASRSDPGQVTGPVVSLIVLTRDGVPHLERLLPALARTAYRSFELIVVDNASTDATAGLLAGDWEFPLQVVTNRHNTSFSAGNNAAADIASGEYLLFLNNGVEPITTGWLGALVTALDEDAERAAAGALLVYPRRGHDNDLTVQHAGISLVIRDGSPRGINQIGPDPLDPSLATTREVEAATAATLLVRKADFDAVGRFDTGYVYGAEDVDLCLRLRDRGRIVVVGDAVLFHHESATQDAMARQLIRVNRIGNWQRFAERWGPRFYRTVQSGAFLFEPGAARKSTQTVAITLTSNDETDGFGDFYTAHELGDAFAAWGWRVLYLERLGDRWYDVDEDIDLLISLLDSFDVDLAKSAFTVAWVRNWVGRWLERPWFENFDLVVAASASAAEEIAHRTRFRPPVIPLGTNPERFSPGDPVPSLEADYVFTGNNWGADREIIALLDVRPEERFLIFGRGWEDEPRVTRHWRGSLGYELLPHLYRSAKIVLDDTAGPTLSHGFVNSRVFDALASGTLVLTNNLQGSEELFAGALPAYSNRRELRGLLDTYLSDDLLRAKTAAELRERVLRHHTYGAFPQRFVESASSIVQAPRVAFKVGVPGRDEIESWGDTHFARAMAASLDSLGYASEIHILPEWDLPKKQHCDIVIHLKGLTPYTPKPGHLNVLWLISHPEELDPGECDKYDLVLVASQSYAEHLATQTRRPVHFLPQATAADRFFSREPEDDLVTPLLFVGNTRGQRRLAIDWAIQEKLPLSVYGGGWRGMIPDEYIVADSFPNERLGALYSSAQVVLTDHWPDMRECGFISNRIFDVLASGGVVLSDRVDGLEELFGDLVPTFDSAEELGRLVRDLTSDEARREAIRSKAADLIRREHTFDQRAGVLNGLLLPLLSGRPKDLEGGTF